MKLDKEGKNTNYIIILGAELTGGAIAGAASAFLLSGPPGVVPGAVAGGCAPLLKRGIIRVVDDIAERFVSQREKIRMGGLINYSANKIKEKLADGEMLRDDGFIELSPTGHPACTEIPIIERPPVEEVIEGILLAVQREHEENKLRFIGNLIANICFDSTIDIAQANWLLKFAKKISFRQMCVLSLYANQDKLIIFKQICAYNPQKYTQSKRESLLQEAVELGLLFKGRNSSFDSMPGHPIDSLYDLWHSESVQVIGVGCDLYRGFRKT
jgi:hypothetical protein